jgi:hypothetical protein
VIRRRSTAFASQSEIALAARSVDPSKLQIFLLPGRELAGPRGWRLALPADDHRAASYRDAAATTLSYRIVSQRKRQVHHHRGEAPSDPAGVNRH